MPASEYTFVSPQVTAVVPDKGPTSGGGQVTVTGSDFARRHPVRFGVDRVAVLHRALLDVVGGPGPPGPAGGGVVDVIVASPDGTSPRVPADRYTYALPGYWLVASDGGIFAYGDAGFYGSTGGIALNRPVVGMAATPDDGGYWLVASDGGIFAFGDAGFYGSTGGIALNKPVVGMAATPDGGGYWLVASDGGIFAYGDARFYGSTGDITLNKPIVGMAATPDGGGYWLVASDGGIFAYGDARFYGSTGDITLNRPIVGMAATPDGGGYWLVASDGGIFAYGDAAFYGSTGDMALNQPVVGMARSLRGLGYWLVASDGGIFAYGDAAFYGSTGGIAWLNRPVVGHGRHLTGHRSAAVDGHRRRRRLCCRRAGGDPHDQSRPASIGTPAAGAGPAHRPVPAGPLAPARYRPDPVRRSQSPPPAGSAGTAGCGRSGVLAWPSALLGWWLVRGRVATVPAGHRPPSVGPTVRPAAAKGSRLDPDWEGDGKPVTLAFGGDVNFPAGSTLGDRLAADPATALGPGSRRSCPASTSPWSTWRRRSPTGPCPDPQAKQYVFYAPATALTAFRGAGVTLVTEANNHGEDCGPAGLQMALAARQQAELHGPRHRPERGPGLHPLPDHHPRAEGRHHRRHPGHRLRPPDGVDGHRHPARVWPPPTT